jgi:hypothetical protein
LDSGLFGRCTWAAFLPLALARNLAQIQEALHSGIWGEFNAKCPKAELDDIWGCIAECYVDDPESLPSYADLFDPNLISGYEEGEWPPRPDSYAVAILPEPIMTRFGSYQESIFGVEWAEFSTEDLEKIIAGLEAEGYECVRDDVLIAKTAPDWHLR